MDTYYSIEDDIVKFMKQNLLKLTSECKCIVTENGILCDNYIEDEFKPDSQYKCKQDI